MPEFLRVDNGIDRKGGVEVQVLAPVNAADGCVDIIGVGSLEVLDGLEYAHGGAKAEIGAVHHFLVAAEGYHAASYLDIVGTEFRQFLCKNFLQSLEGLGNEFELFHLEY